MTDNWNPKDFHDEYHDAVMKKIKDKIAAGSETEPADLPDDKDDSNDEVTTINLMS